MAVLLEAPYSQFLDANGAPLNGGKVYTYTAGTTTPKATFTDNTEVTPAANPIILDSAGRAAIWVTGSYRFDVKTSADVLIRTTDNYTAPTTGGDMLKANYDPANINQQVVGTTAAQTVSNKVFDGTNTFPATGLAYNAIAGFLPSVITGTNTTATLTVATGQAADSGNTAYITKATTTSWAVTNGNAINGYSGGTTLPNSSTIHFFICSGGSGTGTFASTSLTPTFPTGYTTYNRRIFSLNTTAAGAPIPFTSIALNGGGVLNWLTTQIFDINTATTNASRTLYTLTVPTGIRVQPQYRASFYGGVGVVGLFTSGDETDVAPATTGSTFPAAPGFDIIGNTNSGSTASGSASNILTTNTSGQIGFRGASGVTNLTFVTRGFIDWRAA